MGGGFQHAGKSYEVWVERHCAVMCSEHLQVVFSAVYQLLGSLVGNPRGEIQLLGSSEQCQG